MGLGRPRLVSETKQDEVRVQRTGNEQQWRRCCVSKVSGSPEPNLQREWSRTMIDMCSYVIIMSPDREPPRAGTSPKGAGRGEPGDAAGAGARRPHGRAARRRGPAPRRGGGSEELRARLDRSRLLLARSDAPPGTANLEPTRLWSVNRQKTVTPRQTRLRTPRAHRDTTRDESYNSKARP